MFLSLQSFGCEWVSAHSTSQWVEVFLLEWWVVMHWVRVGQQDRSVLQVSWPRCSSQDEKNHYFYTLRCISWWLKATEPSLSDTVFPPKTPSREWPQQVSVLLSAVCPTLCILFLPASLSAHTLVAYLCHSLTVWMFPVNLMNYMNKQILLSICPYFIECKASFS